MFLKTIRFRILFYYGALFTVVLLVFSYLLYQGLKTDLYRNVDEMLKARAEGIRESIDTYWETEKFELIKDGKPVTLNSMTEGSYFHTIAQHLVEIDEKYDSRLIKADVEIFDRNGESVAHSSTLPYSIKIPEDTMNEALKGKSFFDDYLVEVNDKRKSNFRIYVKPIIEDGRVVYIVQAAASLGPVLSAVERQKFILFVLLPLSVLLTGIAGGFLGKFVLKPVDIMIKSARGINAENLKMRIHVPKSNDEVQHLAEAFNELLGRLDEAFTSRQQFTQDIAHELKTPLTIIRGQIDVAAKRTRSSGEYKQILNSTLDEVNRISGIVENLLILSRFENREIRLESKPVDLFLSSATVVKHMKVLADKKDITLSFSGESAIIKADERYLLRLVSNLVDNAIKYTGKKGRVAVSVQNKGNKAVLIVKDNGIGMAKNELGPIFNRFYRVEKSRSKEGHGLGLSIVRSVVEAHKGRIIVKSAPGKGTCFTVFLPLQD
ncbi:MAG: ATP-binding protein [Candidatus Firestonebacteria bacterium]